MWQSIVDLVKGGASFLQNGTAPPNTPEHLQDSYENTNHLASKKFFLAFSGFIILAVFYAASIAVLYTLQAKPEVVPSYVVMYSKAMEVFATIMAVYLGGQALVDLRYNSESGANTSAQIQRTETISTTVAIFKEEGYTLDLDESHDAPIQEDEDVTAG